MCIRDSYNPLTDPDAAKARQAVVLGLMVKTGYISPAQADLAIAEPLTFSAQAFPIKAPHFVAAVWTQLERDYPAALREGGLVVTTTLDLSWQRTAEAVTRQQLERLNQPRDGSPSKNVNNAALVALDPHTGEILALLGSPDYFNAEIDGAVNAALAYRQPGSALKPFTYAASFDPQKTGAWTPATMLLDISTPFVTRRLESYTPANYGLVEHGPVSIREALANSYNIPAVITLDHIGLPAFVALTTRLGLSTLTDTSRLDLSVTLGGGEVRLMDLTAAYAAFANGGQARRPVYIREVRRATGELLYQWTPPPADLPELDPRVAFLITSILSDEAARLPSFGAGSALSLGSRPAAAKTGTTTDFRDNWTVGYTPQVVVGVWVGNADNTPMRDVTGVTGAAPIWNQFIRAVLNGQPELPFSVPDGLIRAEVCALSGLLPTPDCPQRRWEWFIEGTVPTQPDNLYQAFEIDKRTGQLADDNTPPAYRERRVYLVLPPEARAWAKAQGIPEPPVGTQIVSDADAPLRLLAPDPYTVFQLSPHLPLEYQRIRLSVSQLSTLARVVYRLDGVILAEVDSPPFEVWWALTPGEHELQAEASLTTGESLRSPSVPFRVNSWVPPGERPSHGEAE
jgi:membrane peptidoglycan carboxypeptidase